MPSLTQLLNNVMLRKSLRVVRIRSSASRSPRDWHSSHPSHNHNRPQPQGRPLHYSTVPRGSISYVHVDHAEIPTKYHEGGFHVVSIGDVLGDRYEVVHKLGNGGYATVWLAQDRQLHRYVALKICSANANPGESTILAHLAQNKARNRQTFRWNLLSLADHQFHVDGPNGSHACFVSTPAMCSLGNFTSEPEAFPLDVTRSIAAQATMAMAHLHSVGIAHGDLNYGNVLVHPANSIDHLTKEQLYQKFEPPEIVVIERLDENPIPRQPGFPRYLVPPIPWRKDVRKLTLPDVRITLADFGTSFIPDQESRTVSFSPLGFKPPEAMLMTGAELGFASDIWSLGCLIWAIMDTRPFIDFCDQRDADELLSLYMELFGPMPDTWWSKWDAKIKKDRWVKNGTLKDEACRSSLETAFAERIEDFRKRLSRAGVIVDIPDSDEKKAFLAMIRTIMKLDPSRRPTAKSILEMEWMVRWGIPAAEKTWGRSTPI